MHAILYRDPEAPDANDWRAKLVPNRQTWLNNRWFDSPSKAQRAVESIVRGVVKDLHRPHASPDSIHFYRLPLTDGSIRVEWS